MVKLPAAAAAEPPKRVDQPPGTCGAVTGAGAGSDVGSGTGSPGLASAGESTPVSASTSAARALATSESCNVRRGPNCPSFRRPT